MLRLLIQILKKIKSSYDYIKCSLPLGGRQRNFVRYHKNIFNNYAVMQNIKKIDI